MAKWFSWRASGGARSAARETWEKGTRFAIASATKAFTATCLATLVDEGLLSWDSRVGDVLPGFRLHDPWVSGEVTVRDILCHRTGLPRTPLSWYGSGLSRDDMVRKIRHAEPACSFRSEFIYQNVMYVAAGEIIRALTGRTWDKVVRERILTPLGMSETVTSINDPALTDDLATPHERDGEGAVRAIEWYCNDNAGPAGGIISHVRDMAKWLIFQLDETGGGVCDPGILRELHAPQTIIPLNGRLRETMPETSFHTYGLGWFVSDYRGGRVVEHGGNIGGMHSLVSLMPDLKLGIVTLTNFNPGLLPEALRYRLFDTFLGTPECDWSERLLAGVRVAQQERLAAQDAAERRLATNTVPSLSAEAYVGRYTNPVYNDAFVTMEDGELVFSYGSEMVGELEHVQYDTFRTKWRKHVIFGEQTVTFSLNAEGHPATLQLGGLARFARSE